MEIEVLQNEKETAVGVERTRVEDKLEEKRSIRMRYSAEVPILKESGETVIERVDFPPRHDGGKYFLLRTVSMHALIKTVTFSCIF
mmetsp:Transcript_13329/g.13512  ORF Transcript_13329/g.13512 Transcript_13329/m.13512 type:complete len:86 (-) Transcript_13329:809-1066(-)